MWNDRKPDRRPDAIVLAESEGDVVAAVRYACEQGLRVKARSGGHSWTASSVREDGVLVDLSRLQDIAFDPDSRTVSVQPGVRGRDLNALLAEQDLFFPTGHCPTVGVGGYLLQGGWGWNSRAIGPACASVVGVDVVTAEGELIHDRGDWLWAARGAGAGFPGVVTRFHLSPHPLPKAIWTRNDVYALPDADAVLRWAMETEPLMPPELEPVIMVTRGPAGAPARRRADAHPLLRGAHGVRRGRREGARRHGHLPGDRPGDRARGGHAQDVRPALRRPGLHRAGGLPVGGRRHVDAGGSGRAGAAGRRALHSIPSGGPSHVFWFPWRPQEVPDAALSVQAPLYVAAFAGWTDEGDDERMRAWPRQHMERMSGMSVGIQLADENLVDRPARFLDDAHAARLEELRARLDPDGRFHGYLMA